MNCLDGCVLFASLLARCDLNPGILLVPGHALVGWQNFPSGSPDWTFLDITYLVDQDFDAAVAGGSQWFSAYPTPVEVYGSNPASIASPNTTAFLVDLQRVRADGVQTLR
jgi:hypothetical protein